ncbi:trypsin-like peptidase domain-containing protein [Streptomyces cyaneus]|uniref:nSTAND1 domain-containing NTPase n=1 Tax=Streptomyces cyaneus TaxID=1904 RepID=UPI000FF8B421|nr:trypsin-like peptidase domain-containing protein [Streptomyces cyaneus]
MLTQPGGGQEARQSPGPADAAAVAQILAPDGAVAGAGFLAGDGLLLTCAHVLQGAGHGPGDAVRMRFPQAEDAPQAIGTVLAEQWRDPDGDDIAVVLLGETPPGLPVLAVGSAEGFAGQRVRSFGFPAQAPDDGRYGTGTVQGYLNADGRVLLQLDAANSLAQGFSGGPILDEESGLVIGMVTAITAPDRHQRGVNIAYVTPGETLRARCPALAAQDTCPYLDLKPFGKEHSHWFHGRDTARDKVLTELRRRRGVLLQGPSGSGKSSLVQAGVRPELPDGWLTCTARAGQDWAGGLEREGLPGVRADGLLTAVRRRLADEPDNVRLLLVFDQFEELLTTAGAGAELPAHSVDALRQLTEVIRSYESVVVLLVMRVDFYHRLHTLAPELLEAVKQGQIDLFSTLDAEELRAIVTKPAHSVGLRFEEGLPEAIVAEALAAGRRGAADGRAEVSLLPLLEKTLTLLWENRGDNRLTHEAYERIGGLGGSLNGSYERAFRELGPGRRPVAERILSALVRHDETGQTDDVRQARSVEDLRDLTEDSAFDEVLAVLARHRLVITHTPPGGRYKGRPTVELVHEYLIGTWDDLRAWVRRDGPFDAWLRRVESQQRTWEATQSNDDLLQRSDLNATLDWAAQKRALPPHVREFLRRSDDHHKERERRSRRFRRGAFTALSLMAVLLLIAAALAFAYAKREEQAKRDVEERELIATAEGLAAQAEQLRESDPRLALQVGMAADQLHSTAKVRASLVKTLGTTRLAATFSGEGVGFADDAGDRLLVQVAKAEAEGQLLDVHAVGGTRPGRLLRRQDIGAAVALSPDGKLLATVDEDMRVRVRAVGAQDAAEATVSPAFGTNELMTGAEFGADGRRLVLSHMDGTVTLWDTSRPSRPTAVGAPLRVRPKLDADAPSEWAAPPAVSPDGRLIAVAVDRAVTVWSAGAPRREVTRLRLPSLKSEAFSDPYAISQVSFSPDGRTIAAAAVGGVVRWDVTDPEHPALLETLSDAGRAAVFSPDGRTLATIGDDGSAVLWDLTEPSRARRGAAFPAPQEGEAVAIRFSPNGERVMVQHGGSAGGHATVWNLRRPGHPQRLGDELPSDSPSLAVRADGRVLVTAREDGRIDCWDISSPDGAVRISTVRTRIKGGVTALAFRPDGRVLAVGGGGGRAELWDVRDARRPVRRGETPQTTLDRVTTLSYTPDGKTLHLSDNAYVVRWRTGSTAIPLTMGTVYPQFVTRVAFSRQTDTMARVAPYQPLSQVVRERGNLVGAAVQLWPVGDSGPMPGSGARELPGPGNVGSAVEFHPAGRILAVGSPYGTLTLWEIAGAYEPHRRLGLPVKGHSTAISAIAFSPDGTTAATGATDGTIVIWSPDQDGPLNLSGQAATGHEGAVLTMAFSPDSRTLVTDGADGAVRLWDVGAIADARSGPTELACALAGGGLGEVEWASFVPSLPYQDTCS